MYRITERIAGREEDEITIQSRSLLSIMSFISRGIDIPEEDELKNRVVVLPESMKKSIGSYLPFKVYSRKETPVDPYVAVKYRDYWFYIDHSDITTKRTFATVLTLFQLQAPSTAGGAPILTLPAGQ